MTALETAAVVKPEAPRPELASIAFVCGACGIRVPDEIGEGHWDTCPRRRIVKGARCGECEGYGWVPDRHDRLAAEVQCEPCEARGWLQPAPCRVCFEPVAGTDIDVTLRPHHDEPGCRPCCGTGDGTESHPCDSCDWELRHPDLARSL